MEGLGGDILVDVIYVWECFVVFVFVDSCGRSGGFLVLGGVCYV